MNRSTLSEVGEPLGGETNDAVATNNRMPTWGTAVIPRVASAVILACCCAAIAQAPPDYTKGCGDTACHGGLTRGKVIHAPVSESLCDACHEVTDEKKHTFAYTTDAPELCLECHDDMIEDRDFLHGPVAAGACTSCHNPHASENSALLKAPISELCRSCHETIDARMSDRANKHEPAADDCTNCHDPHGGDNSLNLTSAMPDLCLDCHDDVADRMDEAVGHDAVTAGKSCANCHDPHASDLKHMLLGPTMDLCLSCHTEPIKSENATLLGIGKLLADSTSPHGPIRDRDCVACHSPHGGENFRLLTDAYPEKFYSPFGEDEYALCFGCHDVEAFEDEETDEFTAFRNGERNLHHLHVNREVKGRTCRACHDPHAGLGAKHMAKTVPFGSWSLPINYSSTDTGGSCQPGCHKRYRYDREEAVTNLPGS